MLGYTYVERESTYEICELHLVDGLTRLGMVVATCYHEEDAQFVAAAMTAHYQNITEGTENDA